MSAGTDNNRDDAVLAGEYVLDLLSDDERRDVEARLEREPDLRAQVAFWSEQFAGLAEEFGEVAAPAQLKARIDARLFGPPKATARPAGTHRSQPAGPRWVQVLGGVLMAAALAALTLTFLPQIELPGPGPSLSAEIAGEDRALVVTAAWNEADGALVLDRLAGEAPPGRVLELWLIAPDATAPVSLGVLPQARQAFVIVPDALQAGLAGGTLAISEEPPGGAPQGVPTGRILAAGGLEPV